LQPSGKIRDEAPEYLYTQADAYLYGGEAGFHFHPHPLDWLHINCSYSNTTGQDKYRNDLPLMPSQKIHATVSASFSGKQIVEKFSVYLNNQYLLAQNQVASYEEPSPAYNLLSAGMSVELSYNKQKLLFNVAANNLFNAVYYDHLSRYKTDGIYNMGRNFHVGLSIPLQWKL
jgi:iron complex outermembrane receptor protein